MVNNLKKIHWTEHSKIKMRQYGLSITKLLKILRNPERKERGIAPGTTAAMRTNKVFKKMPKLFGDKERDNPPKANTFGRASKAPGEIWIMYRDTKMQSVPTRKIISAWRYPGVSKPGEAIPIPEEIRLELENNNDLK